MKRFAHGRWDRQQPHVLEIRYDNPACWAVCSCGWEGELRRETAQADADAESHERFVFETQKAGKRLVRGRVE